MQWIRKEVDAVVASHSPEAPEAAVQPGNVEQSPRLQYKILNLLVLGVVGSKSTSI